MAQPTDHDRPVLVTGGAGFVGANLVRHLGRSGRSVRVLDSLVNGRTDYLDGTGAELVEGDILDGDAVAAAMTGVRDVVHLAAAGSVVESVSDPWGNFESNVRGTLSVLDAARRTGVERLVFSSTGGALIGDAAPPVSEESVPRPLSPYGASKAAAEAYCHAFAKSYGLRTVALRFANVYGPYSGHKKGAVTAFFRALHAGEPLTVFGTGTASRDFMHVDDICAALMLALTADVPGGSVMHVATGVETTVNELAALCADVAGRPGHPIDRRPARPGEVDRNFARYDLAAKLLGFEPTVALRDGLAGTWDWYAEHVFVEGSPYGAERLTDA
ncbi:MAG: NAD-dependent epimerase/dehydratase family protein [Frankiaceae bacterium]